MLHADPASLSFKLSEIRYRTGIDFPECFAGTGGATSNARLQVGTSDRCASAPGADGDDMNSLRGLVPMTDTEIEGLFRRIGYTVRVGDLDFTTQTIDDFWFARYESWADPGRLVRYEPGLLIIAAARPHASSVPRDVVVMGFVLVRLVLGMDREESIAPDPRAARYQTIRE